jgi:hypothetical protein
MRVIKHGAWWVLAGVLCAVLVAEGGIRLLEPALPSASSWPTVETDVKSRQLDELSADVDILFLGTSLTEAGVDPAILMGLTGADLVYNAALPFATPLSNQVWLDEVVLERVVPSVVVIGIAAWPPHTTINDDPLRAGLLATSTDDAGLSASALFRQKGVLAEWDQRDVRERSSSSNLWTDLGHMRGYYEVAPGSMKETFPPYGEPAMSSDNSAALAATIRDLRAAGTSVVLLIEPAHYPGSVLESDVDAYLDSITQVGEELGVEVWDTYHVGWRPEMYADGAHFNRTGTEAFTEHLAGLVRESSSLHAAIDTQPSQKAGDIT